MTQARDVVPMQTYFLTRRCNERQFFFTADDETPGILVYCLAEAALRYGVLVHGVCAMSNHLHIEMTDVRGELPNFSRDFFGQLAKSLNAATGHIESVFARSRRYSAVKLVTEEAMAKELAYALANPADADLVDTALEWPGFITTAKDMLTRKKYIGSVGKNPYLAGRKNKTLVLEIVPPPHFEGDPQGLAGFVAEVEAQLLAFERIARAKRNKEGTPVKGAHAVRMQKWYHRPKSSAPIRKLNPTIAAVRADARVAAIVALQKFRADYRNARDAFRAKNREVVFPYGTWWMRVYYKANVAPPPAAAA